jgi:hypothetical protein
MKGRTVEMPRAAGKNGKGSKAIGKAVSWQDFADTVETLAKKLAAIKGVSDFDGLAALVRAYWNDRASLMVAVADIVVTQEPYDPNSGRLKPLMSTIAMALDRGTAASSFFPEYQKKVEEYQEIERERHRDFISLVMKKFRAQGGEKTQGPQSTAFAQFLHRLAPGKTTSHKQSSIDGYRMLIDKPGTLLSNGKPRDVALDFFAKMKFSPSEIRDIIAPRKLGARPAAAQVLEQAVPG